MEAIVKTTEFQFRRIIPFDNSIPTFYSIGVFSHSILGVSQIVKASSGFVLREVSFSTFVVFELVFMITKK